MTSIMPAGGLAMDVVEKDLPNDWPAALKVRRTVVVLPDAFVFRAPGVGQALVEAKQIAIAPAHGLGLHDVLLRLARPIDAACAVLAGCLPLRGAAIKVGDEARLLLGGPRTGTTTLSELMVARGTGAPLVDGIVPVTVVGDRVGVSLPGAAMAFVPIADVTVLRRGQSAGVAHEWFRWQPTHGDILDLAFLRDVLPAWPQAERLWHAAVAVTMVACALLEIPSTGSFESVDLPELGS